PHHSRNVQSRARTRQHEGRPGTANGAPECPERASQKFHFGETASRNEGQVSAFAPRHQSDFSSWTNADDDQARRKVRTRNRRESAGTPRRLDRKSTRLNSSH